MSKRDAVIVAGWVTVIVGFLLALGVAFGLIAAGFLTLALALFVMSDQ